MLLLRLNSLHIKYCNPSDMGIARWDDSLRHGINFLSNPANAITFNVNTAKIKHYKIRIRVVTVKFYLIKQNDKQNRIA